MSPTEVARGLQICGGFFFSIQIYIYIYIILLQLRVHTASIPTFAHPYGVFEISKLPTAQKLYSLIQQLVGADIATHSPRGRWARITNKARKTIDMICLVLPKFQNICAITYPQAVHQPTATEQHHATTHYQEEDNKNGEVLQSSRLNLLRSNRTSIKSCRLITVIIRVLVSILYVVSVVSTLLSCFGLPLPGTLIRHLYICTTSFSFIPFFVTMSTQPGKAVWSIQYL